jgi:hypothetical protein
MVHTAAFCSPTVSTTCINPSGTAFGDAGRFIIEGPAIFAEHGVEQDHSNS